MKNKKYLAVLSSAAIGALMTSVITTTAYAKAAKVDNFIENSSIGYAKNITYSPTVKSIEFTNTGELYITFDRSMDIQTVLDPANYDLNGRNLGDSLGLTSVNNFSLTDNDCTLKIRGLSNVIDTGSNVFYISNRVKDLYGNKIGEDTRLSFEATRDQTKPKVLGTSVIDNETIGIMFSKDVDSAYAENPANYKILNEKNENISNYIDKIYSYKGEKNQGNTNIYKIKMKKVNLNDPSDSWNLNNSKYTLKVSNIADTAISPNVMDEYTTILNASDSSLPKGTAIFNNSKNKQQVVVCFNEAMDRETLIQRTNYQFIDGKGNVKSLPLGAIVTAGESNKSAIVEFPVSYDIKTNGSQVSSSSENDVCSLIVSNVKDNSGNLLNGFSYDNDYAIAEAKTGAVVKPNTIKAYYDKGDLKIDIQFSRSIDKTNKEDFAVGRVIPSSITHNGNVVTLTFKNGEAATKADIMGAGTITYANGKTNGNPTKIDLVKAQGQSAKLEICATDTTDETGALICRNNDGSTINTTENQARIYDYDISPQTTCFNSNDNYGNYWTATKYANGGKAYITFDEPLDVNSNIRTSDVAFIGLNGTEIRPDNVAIDMTHPNTIVFSFYVGNKNYSAFTGSINLAVKKDISLEAQRDLHGNSAKYVPSSYDMSLRKIIINEEHKNQ